VDAIHVGGPPFVLLPRIFWEREGRLTTRLLIALSLVLCGWPAWAQPDYRARVEQLAAQYPDAFACAHARPQRACNWDFSYIVAIELHKIDPAVGANRKRGTGELSEDALAILHPQGDTVDITGPQSFVIDYINCAGGDPGVCAPSVGWSSVGGVSGWVDPRTIPDPRGSSPQPPFPGVDWAPSHAAVLTRFGSSATTREIAEQFAFSFAGEEWGQKAAAVDRPISGDVIARRYRDGRLVGFRVVPPSAHPMQFDLTGQHFVPVGAVDHLGLGSAPPVEPGPTPPDLQPLLDAIAALAEKVEALEGTIHGFGTSVLPVLARLEATLDARPTTASEWPQYVGTILGRTAVLSPRAPIVLPRVP